MASIEFSNFAGGVRSGQGPDVGMAPIQPMSFRRTASQLVVGINSESFGSVGFRIHPKGEVPVARTIASPDPEEKMLWKKSMKESGFRS